MDYHHKPWLKHYDEGVSHTLAPYPKRTVFDLLDQSAREAPDQPACVMSVSLPVLGRKYHITTYHELAELSDRFAAALQEMGIQKGDRVAICSPNCTQFAIVFFGILKAGAIAVPLNPTYPAVRQAELLRKSGAKLLITLARFYKDFESIRHETALQQMVPFSIKEYLPSVVSFLYSASGREKRDGDALGVLRTGDTWLQEILNHHKGKARPDIQIDPELDIAVFQYTGGTSGIPRAAMLAHQGLFINTEQIRSFFTVEAPNTFLAATPFFHVYGLVAVLIMAAASASPMYMVPNPRDTLDVVQQIDYFRPAIYMGVPALYNAVNHHPLVRAGRYEVGSIRVCISGAAPLSAETKQRFEALTGGTVVEGFGMTELGVASHANPLRGTNKVGSIGVPLPDVECRIVSFEDSTADAPVGEIGELAIRTPTLMHGYHNMPQETEAVLGEGWLLTGDIAYMDGDGYFFIVDRKKDMALIGGFNVYPAIVEKVILEHPAVQEVSVASIPHPERTGQEALKAWVVLEDGATLTAETLVAYCRSRLADHELPRRIEFVSDLPKSIVGKVLRRALLNGDNG